MPLLLLLLCCILNFVCMCVYVLCCMYSKGILLIESSRPPALATQVTPGASGINILCWKNNAWAFIVVFAAAHSQTS
jgi:hypothetical protein